MQSKIKFNKILRMIYSQKGHMKGILTIYMKIAYFEVIYVWYKDETAFFMVSHDF